ncbi:recombinase family protein [Armatimonas rosea]|uniref:DNA invertase Pin-like site-specific DNA recombinase n=1 Tax=Armatimonas rosea TaxID=685828 RepID=A0A7W9SYD7_ARMRO|nr:recombinase family protein [Armatimonas rosea]MBB6054134.1 DNA invertase Pin-like site-specific DNA recombinase [Armatimonas rosea]
MNQQFTAEELDEALKIYRAEQHEKQREGITKRAALGKYTGHIPYGYQLNSSTGKLESNPEEKHICQRIAFLHCQGNSLRQISHTLLSEQHLTRSGKKFHASAIKLIIQRTRNSIRVGCSKEKC